MQLFLLELKRTSPKTRQLFVNDYTCISIKVSRGQDLEQANVERPIFRNFEISKFRILNERKMIYSIFFSRIYSSFLYLFKLFVHSKFMIIYKIGNL